MAGQPVILDTFGGIVSTARPEDLPDGASPRNNDVDFVVGRFIQRPGTKNVYSYAGAEYGPHGGGTAVDVNTAGNPWSNVGNTLLNTGVYATATVGGSSSLATTTAAGTSVGGGVSWTNPANIDSSSVYASASLSAGGGTYTPSTTTGTAHVLATSFNQNPVQSVAIGSFASTAATGATLYVTVNGSNIDGGSGNGMMVLSYSINGGTSWTVAQTWNVTFSSTVVTIPVTGITNLSSVEIQIQAVGQYDNAGLNNDNVTISVTNWYATVGGGSGLTSQTLQAAFSGITVPTNATITGVLLSFHGYYTGATPTVTLSLNVGTEVDSYAMLTVPGTYLAGSSSDLWGYSSWTASTINSLVASFNASSSGTTSVFLNNVSMTVYFTVPNTSDQIHLQQFTFGLPTTASITGIGMTVQAFGAGGTLYAQLLKNGVAVGNTYSVAMGSVVSTLPLGGANDAWGASWAYSDVDSPTFGIALWVEALSGVSASIGYCTLAIFGTATSVNFNGITGANLNQTDQVTLALDANGATWEEDVTNAAGQLALTSIIPLANPGAYLKGVDANGSAYMAYSDLTQGTSQPMQYNGAWCDRITQVGPGQAPTFTPQQTTSNTFAITNITQPAAFSQGFSYFLQSSGPGSTTPGNVITFYYQDSTLGGPNADLVAAMATGNAVYVYASFTGTPVTFGPEVVQVTSIGEASPPNQPRQFYYLTFVVTGSAFTYYQGSGHAGYTANFQRSLATMNMTVPVPGLVVGNQVTIAGNTVAAYNSAWTITQALNSGAMQITSTAVSGGIATYNYAMQSGVAPVAGELVTITNTTNANGQLNLTNATINTASGGSTGNFTILVSITTTFPSSAEPSNAVATTAGSIFAFDPGAALVTTGTNPIYGTGTGGTLTFSSAANNTITPGVKQGSVFFITRNGAVTRPAPPVQFTVPTNCGAIVASNVPIGPPNVVARGITFTESGQNEVAGANFYFYDTAQSYTVNGIKLTSDALTITDNTSTSATFSFSDSVLLASDEIDIPGNDYFNLIELGNPAWMFQYANRMLYGLCQTKVQNFLNMSFDGGYLPAAAPLLSMPTGWTYLSSAGVGLVKSLDFGNAFTITNTGGTAYTNAQVLFQSAYQDYLNVNIVQPNTPYSVRVKARSIGFDGQTVTIQLPTYANGVFAPSLFGSASFTFNQGSYQTQTATLITGNGLVTVPQELQIALGVNALAVGAEVEIDRIEVFPTNSPVDTTTIWTSYANKFESVDINSGRLGVGAENSQPATGAFEILEQLYIEKSKSLSVTQDSPNYEPNNWSIRQASDRAGAVGPNAFDEGEEFTLSANRNGVYYFDGGKPQPILRELQNTAVGLNLWESVNWNAGKTIWIRNDLNNRRLLIGIPMITPNPWLPKAAASTPSSPNVILMCNYTGCPTGAELADSAEVHMTMFGDLKALDMKRKWSLWQIPCPVAEFVPRADGFTAPLFLCNGINSSKIYQLVNGAADGSGQNTDDGMPINWSYTTYGLVKAKQGQQVQGLGALRKLWTYFAATMEGVGQVAAKLYSNTLGALQQNTFTVPLPFTLSSPAQHDQERVLEIGGQRVFIEFTSVGTGGYAEIGPVMIDGEMDKISPHRGVSS